MCRYILYGEEYMATHNRTELVPCLKKLEAGIITFREASLITGYSTVQLHNLSKKFALYGESCLINGHKGQIPANKIPENVKKKIVSEYKKNYEGINFKFFAKMYKEDHPTVKLSYTTIYTILSRAGIKSPEKRRVPHEEVHRPRPRKEHEGEMLQIDATPYQWFDWCGDKTYYALHGSIDDATGKVTALTMCENECLYGYLELVRQTYFTHGFGHPYSIYSDRAAIFCFTPRQRQGDLTLPEIADALKEEKTQWQRAMTELGVKQILAFSPQAKGRIERLWHTLQGRLPFYFKKNKIKTMDKANEFLKEYIKEYNEEFAVEPVSKVKVWHSTGLNPDYVLSARFIRQTNASGIFSFHNCKFRIEKKDVEKQKIEICVNMQGIRAYIKGMFYPVTLVERNDGISSQVLDNIIYKYMLKDCKKSSV